MGIKQATLLVKGRVQEKIVFITNFQKACTLPKNQKTNHPIIWGIVSEIERSNIQDLIDFTKKLVY